MSIVTTVQDHCTILNIGHKKFFYYAYSVEYKGMEKHPLKAAVSVKTKLRLFSFKEIAVSPLSFFPSLHKISVTKLTEFKKESKVYKSAQVRLYFNLMKGITHHYTGIFYCLSSKTKGHNF